MEIAISTDELEKDGSEHHCIHMLSLTTILSLGV